MERRFLETKALSDEINQTISVATSDARGRGGVFGFTFRDEWYIPFEGAVSSWQLDLRGNFRPFDYRTITDVLINVSFTAGPYATATRRPIL
jgi:hypothetical protein